MAGNENGPMKGDAMSIAIEARTRIRSHEEDCTRRDAASEATMSEFRKDVKDGLNGIHGKVDTLHGKIDEGLERVHSRVDGEKDRVDGIYRNAIRGIIGLLLSILAYFAVKGVPWIN